MRALGQTSRAICCCSVVLGALVLPAAEAKDAPQVEMVILAEQNPNTSTVGRKWGDLLTGLGVGNLQIRAAHSGEKIGIEVRGTKDAPSSRVTGNLTDGALLVPGGKFTLADRATI